MNPWDLGATGLLVWGLVAHLIADWLLQSHWMATNKAERRQPAQRRGDGRMTPPRMYQPPTRWWDRHPAAYVHAGTHGAVLALVFGWVAVPLAVAHLVIDCRWVVAKWAELVGQSSAVPGEAVAALGEGRPYTMRFDEPMLVRTRLHRAGGLEREDLRGDLDELRHELEDTVDLFTVGMLVRMAVDQVFHVVTIAAAALAVANLS